MELYCSLALAYVISCIAYGGGFEPWPLGCGEPPVEYPTSNFVLLTSEQALGQRLMGSLTGAVASERVTEARNGSLKVDGNHLLSALA